MTQKDTPRVAQQQDGREEVDYPFILTDSVTNYYLDLRQLHGDFAPVSWPICVSRS